MARTVYEEPVGPSATSSQDAFPWNRSTVLPSTHSGDHCPSALETTNVTVPVAGPDPCGSPVAAVIVVDVPAGTTAGVLIDTLEADMVRASVTEADEPATPVRPE